MTVTKLSSDSPQPAAAPGKVQLFGSEFSPFVQRVRMVLIARNVPHEVYDVNGRSKPAWYKAWQPDPKLPVLRAANGQVLSDGHDIMKYLHENYSGPGHNPALRERNQDLMKKFEPVMENFWEHVKNKDYKPSENIRAFFEAFEEELTKRGTTFLGGESPGTPDYLLWPWFERFHVPFVLHGKDHKPPSDRAPHKNVAAWKQAMEKTKPVIETKHTIEEHVEVCKRFLEK